LIGDAAHAITIYHGEAVNHGITDVSDLMQYFMPALGEPDGMLDTQAAYDTFEENMVDRTKIVIRASQQACLDAHYSDKIDKMSPLVSKRAIIA
jgi:2-polyprenyl-6-methoxyphenol hydroxylase-like FAD-dependent oxidoreductase